MARRQPKIEIRTQAAANFDALWTIEMLLNFKKQHERPKPRVLRRPASSSSEVRKLRGYKPVMAQELDVGRKNRVFLYLQLQSIENLPKTESKLMIQLRHKGRLLGRQDEHHFNDTDIDVDEAKEDNYTKPTFSLSIEQDSLDEMNYYSDSPLLITIYEERGAYEEEEEEEQCEEEECHRYLELHPLAQGYIDMLQFFTKRRSISTIDTFLYPFEKTNIDKDTGTPKTTWHIYTLLPLLKEVNFCNMIFLAFESIYNVPPGMPDPEDIVVEISFQSKRTNAENKFDVISICDFSRFSRDIISKQDPYQKWESINREAPTTERNLTAHSGGRISMAQLFNDILGEENVNYHYDAINGDEDYAYVANSLRRYVLSQDLVDVLQEAIAFQEQQLLVEVYKEEDPDTKLLTGVIDLSIFLYPNVNACRFAVQLKPPDHHEQHKSETPIKKSKITEPNERPTTLPCFAILNICLMYPLTVPQEKISKVLGRKIDAERLRACGPLIKEPEYKPVFQMCSEAYARFDEQITSIIDLIAKKDIRELAESKNIFCCHLANLSNRIMKLISCDFNIRQKTTNTMEFTNLLVTVYNELTQRVYTTLENCTDLLTCQETVKDHQDKIMEQMGTIKLLAEAGDEVMAKFLMEKLKALNAKHYYPYCRFLYNVEKQEFDEAKLYLDLPKEQRFMEGDYFSMIVGFYIKYCMLLKEEEEYNQALQYLLLSLEQFVAKNTREVAVWVLLHCLYRSCSYTPGMAFTRVKYENIPNQSAGVIPTIPTSLWQLYCGHKLKPHSAKGLKFQYAMDLFLQFGLYRFALIVFEYMKNECTDVEIYMMETTFKILLQDVPAKYSARKFTVNNPELAAFVAQVNGNLEYFKENLDLANDQYATVLRTNYNYENGDNYQLSLLRYGRYQLETAGNNEMAIEAFEKCIETEGKKLVEHYYLGRAFYRVGKYKEAEEQFSDCTDCKIHMPDVWAYLALVNIKMGKEFKALESWKYAKINPKNEICSEVLEELAKIDTKDLKLYVERPFDPDILLCWP